jgi:glycosyltransferase involved in cell wall biosynthesis
VIRIGRTHDGRDMKLLISTYACAPDRGSEHAVGWNWTTGTHRLGHQVWAMTSAAHRAVIETACRKDKDLAGINWIFPEIPAWPLRAGVEPIWERTYNLLWQFAALRHARALQRDMRFDAAHHLTWGGVRAPTFLGALGAPLIVGPIGGGETSPAALRDTFTLRSRIAERIRDLSNASITLNPITRGGLAHAKVIFVKTSDTARLLTGAMQRKSKTFMELTLQRSQLGAPRRLPPGPPRLLFAGRLLYWKGAHIAIRALAALLPRAPEARLTIVGKGPEGGRLKADAAAMNLGDRVEFIPWLPQQELFALFRAHHLFVFPSLHDSSGNVVLEALSHGLPVMCLDLGGPRDIVTPQSGIVVGTSGLDTLGVATAMANEMQRLFTDPERLAALSSGALARAGDFILSDRISAFYLAAGDAIGYRAAAEAIGVAPHLAPAEGRAM